MSLPIFKNTCRCNWKLLLIFVVVLCLYLSIIISLINPEDMTEVQDLFGTMENFMGAFSIDIAAMTSPLSYTASTFFSVLVMAFTMVFYLIQANGLIAKQVDNTSLACTLSAPVKRSTLVLTKGIYLLFSMAVLFISIFACGSVLLNAYEDFQMAAYANLVGVTFCICTSVAMLSYFFSVAFCGSKLGTVLAVGGPIALLFFKVISGIGGEKTEWLSKLTPFGYLDSVGIVTGRISTLGLYIIFGSISLLLLTASVFAFNRRQLPL